MASVIYKDGQLARVPANRLKAHLDAGWSTSPNAPKPVEVKAEQQKESFEKADTNGSGKLSNDEVRQAAKEAGIEDWDKRRIKPLKQELGLE